MAVSGVTTPLGALVAQKLAGAEDVEVVIGLDGGGGDGGREPAGIPVERVDSNFRALTDFLGDHRIDSVVHAGMADSRSGAARTPHRANVIDTMQLAAAVSARTSPVRTLVAASTTDVYPSSSHSSLLHPESEELHPIPDSPAASALEAEGYVRELAVDSPHIAVSVLRLADLVGAGTTSPLAGLLGLPLVPVVAGFDPQVQFLHGGDAAAALAHACLHRLAGTFNVAGEGSLRWSEAVRLSGRTVALVPPLAVGRLEPVMTRLRLPVTPAAMLDVLRYGRCVATEEIRDTGFTAGHSTRTCVSLLAVRQPMDPRQRLVPGWLPPLGSASDR